MQELDLSVSALVDDLAGRLGPIFPHSETRHRAYGCGGRGGPRPTRKKALTPRVDTPATVEKKISLTDPDSGYMVRDGKPTGFFYLDLRTVDGKHAIITDPHVTPASVHDSVPYLARLDHQCQRFGLNPVGLDAGYFTAAICHGLEERGLHGVIGYRRPSKLKGYLPKRAFTYDAATNIYQCPEGQSLIYATTDRNGYRHYRSDPEICRRCPRLDTCTRNARQIKTVTRHVWQDDKDRVDAWRLTEPGKKLYKRRKETVERSFADAKQLHGHRYARMRGLARVKEQCLLAAACQNLKKIAQARWRWLFYAFLRHLRAHMAYQRASCPTIIRCVSIAALTRRAM